MKAVQWERCKGELRAMVALQGSHDSVYDEPRPLEWERLRDRVEDFIKDVEDHSLAE